MPSVVVRQTVDHLLETAYLKGALDRTRPSQVYIDITSRCNCRCVMCHVWKSEPGDELSTRQWVDVLRDIARWPGPGTKVNISGGEPLLRADLPELLGEATRLGLAVGFVTNGSLITEELAATIVDSGVFNVNVSLDSLDPAIHDRLRGVAGTTTKALAAFEHLAAAAARRPDRPVALVRQDDDHGTHPRAGPSGLREQQRLWARRPPVSQRVLPRVATLHGRRRGAASRRASSSSHP
jgi:sulfatase maturation enzyme AslB (radical SAM superfamily)